MARKKGFIPPNHISMARMLEWIPNDGCLLVFNAIHDNWRPAVHNTGVLRCLVADNGHYGGKQSRLPVRDLYICWKE